MDDTHILISVIIDKPMIAKLGAIKGFVNSSAIRLTPGGEAFPISYLQFVGFVGKCNLVTYQWGGYCTFRKIPTGSTYDRADFVELFPFFTEVNLATDSDLGVDINSVDDAPLAPVVDDGGNGS